MITALAWLATFLLTGESRRRFEELVDARLPRLRTLFVSEAVSGNAFSS
jgi:hypothetical protein